MAEVRHSGTPDRRAGGNSLPEGWCESTIGELAEVNPKKIDADLGLKAGFVPMALAPVNFLDSLEHEEKTWGEIKKSYTNFQDNDVIFAKVTPCFENGKAAIVRNLPNAIGAGSSEFYVLRAHKSLVSEKLLFAVVKTFDFLQQGAENMTGAVGLRRVPRSFVEAFPVPLPPLAEQKVIAEKLDTLLARVDTTKARLERIPDIIKRFRQSVLAAAVSGKLTEEWRGNVKTDWCQTTLNECSDRIGDGLHGTPNYNDNGEYFFVNGNNLINGSLKIKESTKKVDFEEYSKHRKELGASTLLLSINGTIGNLALYNGEPVMLGKSACYINLKDTVNRNFCYHLLSSLHFNQYAHEVATGATIKNVPLKGIRNYKFWLPPLEEQTEIVRRVEELFAFADSIEQKAAAALERVNNLTQSILAKAFRGELTANWRAANPELISGDNSAEALLAKIHAEREALALEKKAAKKNRKKKD